MIKKQKIRRIIIVGCTLAISALALPVQASNWADKTTINGFMSTRYSITDEKAFFEGDRDTSGINEDGSFQGTKLGLNLHFEAADNIVVATQIFSSLEEDKYSTHLDWAFARFQLSETLALRTGNIKYPVGLVNEYIEVGITYPWIQAPIVIYSESAAGPQATREAYTGASLVWEAEIDDWLYSADLFAGQVDLEQMTIKGLAGLSGRAIWNDMLEVHVATYAGEMKTDPTFMMGMMNDKEHKATVAGIKIDWNNIVAYSEAARVSMDVKMAGNAIGDSDSWYATLGYRLGQLLPHVTVQDWERDNGSAHHITTLGLTYSMSAKSDVKFELSNIDTETSGPNTALFDGAPSDNSTKLYSLAVDLVF